MLPLRLIAFRNPRSFPCPVVRFIHTTRIALRDTGKDDLTRARQIIGAGAEAKKKSAHFVKTFDNTVESARKKYLNKLKFDLGEGVRSLSTLTDGLTPVIHHDRSFMALSLRSTVVQQTLISAYAAKTLPTKLVLDSLKDMQAYRLWTPSGNDREPYALGVREMYADLCGRLCDVQGCSSVCCAVDYWGSEGDHYRAARGCHQSRGMLGFRFLTHPSDVSMSHHGGKGRKQ